MIKSKSKKRKGHAQKNPRKSVTKEKSSPESSGSSSNADSELEIPGFYYDKERKKYFKILPSTNNTKSSSFITNEYIQNKNVEDNRITDLEKMCKTNNEPNAASSTKSFENVKSILTLVNHSNFGLLSNSQSKMRISKTMLENISPTVSQKLFPPPLGPFQKLEHMLKMIPTQSDGNSLVCVWNLKDLLAQKLQKISIESIEKLSKKKYNMDISTETAIVPKSYSKITSLCNASISSREETENILYTTMCAIGNSPSFAMIRNLKCNSANDYRIIDFNLGSKVTWCCAWNPNAAQFSVGTEKSGLLIDVETRKLWELKTNNSDVLSQCFKRSDSLLFSGTRKGCICGHDLRSNSTFVVSKFHHKSPVCHIHVMEDENYLIGADFSGEIKKWDMRQRKVLINYHGHNNAHSVIPFHVNNEERILYAAGQDCYTRIWDINSGELIKSIPPPHPAAVSIIPLVYYSTHMGRKSNRTGLLMGILDELHFYSL